MKFKLTEETLEYKGHTLYRIEALEDFYSAQKGDKGGFIESEENLSQDGNCWVYDYVKVYGSAEIYDNAKIYGNANIYGNAIVYDNANVYGNAQVCGNARVFDNARVLSSVKVGGNATIIGDAKIKSIGDYIVFKNWWSSGRYLT